MTGYVKSELTRRMLPKTKTGYICRFKIPQKRNCTQNMLQTIP